MSLKQVYERFLAEPTAASLSADAALNYITTTTAFSTPEPIIKHLQTQSRALKKKSEKIVNVVEGPRSICLDVETSLEFLTGGGAYLPSLDDNFLVDRVVTLPIIHIIHFDNTDRITQIRLYWDQGSLLKQIDVIGSSSRNWPIRDSAEQLRLINSSVSAAGNSPSSISSSASQGGRPSTAASNNASIASITSPSKRFTKDPHASLSLFESHSDTSEDRPVSVSSRGSAKPAPRDYGDLFVGDDADFTPTKPPQLSRKDGAAIAPKSGADANYQASRLFADEDGQQGEQDNNSNTNNNNNNNNNNSRTPSVKTNSKKFNHFEFGETPHPGSTVKSKAPNHFEFGVAEPPISTKPQKQEKNHFEFGEADPDSVHNNIPIRPRSNKHNSQWDFEDFVTPVKPKQKVQSQNVRHFGWSDNEADGDTNVAVRPFKPPQPRRDAETHFELRDEGTPAAPGQKRVDIPTKGPGVAHNKGLGLYENNLYDDSGTPVSGERQRHRQEYKMPTKGPGVAHNKGLGLYENNLYDEFGTPIKGDGEKAGVVKTKAPLGVIPNGGGVNRRKDFDSHWVMRDDEAEGDGDGDARPGVGEDGRRTDENRGNGAGGIDRKKAGRMMEASWNSFEEQEGEGEAEKRRMQEQKRVGRVQSQSQRQNQRHWGFGDEGDM
ncbi:hypothetical protein PAAG_04817 [Paracoccidioides lutzii Pb01]|uniref:Uncharacterized protein n=1 Tax=Paracoccidioides lutzii (strain ATCC MYA-826 / Pb01) TaxID=502779 RepID=C1H1N1_PARBA|nr:hypothetical protein PAAG_04817 [Paracoccidioides lutzii Pb01]EEH33768.1 hypothetical protein PAAG_04817 [Paracoccidioides lutzii Pb01]